MQTGGYIGIGIGGVSSLLSIQEVCNTDSGVACEKIKLTGGGKFMGSTLGGFAGGKAASAAIGFTPVGKVICVALAVGTGAWMGTTCSGQLIPDTSIDAFSTYRGVRGN